MAEKVYYISLIADEAADVLEKKVVKLFKRSNLGKCFEAKDIVGVKVHIGEKGNITYLPPHFVKYLVTMLRKSSCLPFLTDTNVLYKGNRNNAVDHIMLANEHGYNIENTGAPFVVMDGLMGRNEIEIEINCENYKNVPIAAEAVYASSLLVVTHVTAHVACGLGSTIKNLGMGFSSRKGKLNQHSQLPPEVIESKCTGCGICHKMCPTDAIIMKDKKAVIIEEKCISCGECIAICRYDAITFKWASTSEVLQKRIAEHALGVMKNKKDKIGFITFMINQTNQCDCMGIKMKRTLPDFGVLAGFDPVAVDKAVLDISQEKYKTDISSSSFPSIDPTIQLKYGEKIGLGSMDYKLIQVV
ncbi:DUF362 domain-containing protein [candidate division KSB1 bacterium]